jgi:hypothetical protein
LVICKVYLFLQALKFMGVSVTWVFLGRLAYKILK